MENSGRIICAILYGGGQGKWVKDCSEMNQKLFANPAEYEDENLNEVQKRMCDILRNYISNPLEVVKSDQILQSQINGEFKMRLGDFSTYNAPRKILTGT